MVRIQSGPLFFNGDNIFSKQIEAEVEKQLDLQRPILLDQLRTSITSNIKELVKKECMLLVIEMFSDRADSHTNYDYGFIQELQTVGGEFKRQALISLEEKINPKCQNAAKTFVEGEEFIDTIIKRIKTKQLV